MAQILKSELIVHPLEHFLTTSYNINYNHLFEIIGDGIF